MADKTIEPIESYVGFAKSIVKKNRRLWTDMDYDAAISDAMLSLVQIYPRLHSFDAQPRTIIRRRITWDLKHSMRQRIGRGSKKPKTLTLGGGFTDGYKDDRYNTGKASVHDGPLQFALCVEDRIHDRVENEIITKIPNERDKYICQRLADGATQQEIANELGVSGALIHHELKRIRERITEIIADTRFERGRNGLPLF